MKVLAGAVLVVFGTFSSYVASRRGYWSAFPPFADFSTLQIFCDLTISLSLVLGSMGPLLYLLFRNGTPRPAPRPQMDFLTIYLWVLLLSSMVGAAVFAGGTREAGLRWRLAAWFALYNLFTILIRMVMPTKEEAVALAWMNPLLGLAAKAIFAVDARLHPADPVTRVAVRATATLAGSTGLWVALGWFIGSVSGGSARD